jgi:tetrahydromethanopterin S-methyltransferase subunit G
MRTLRREVYEERKKSTEEEIPNKLVEELEKKEKRIEALEEKVREAESAVLKEGSNQDLEAKESQVDEVNPYLKSSFGRKVDREVAVLGKIFADWCQTTDGENLGHVKLFAERLEEKIPGAEVQRFCREKYAEGLVFTESAREPVEYWLVRLGQRSLLLPKPQRSGFRELEECFEAKSIPSDDAEPVLPAIAPRDVKHLLPATLVEEGGRGRTLGEEGWISTGHMSGTEGSTTGSVSRKMPTARTIGEVFVEWCHSEDTMIGRYYMFERTLNETLPDAEVSPIYHQSDAEGRYSFDVNNTSGEFWLVEAEGERWLLPAPQKRDRFVATEKAFNGDEASPSAVSEVTPAQMGPDGAHYELQRQGRLKAAVAP